MLPDGETFEGSFMIPVDQHNDKHYWPSTHILCDYGELAKHDYRTSNVHRITIGM
ncbi:hypothetical protein A5844_001278 [Enterococcus sp. 10A9_DIV0425]|uniref:Uncharacterized protein n=1 Tax=Candidatus Enterococcus wittei TaxID=1987383 RepID=A0A242K1J4_9ENTE|nr:hypothetical protein [Enterococcus sp. 10A9_DIV0425]OTP11144.1 hypothetical protein A5844_001278 [Enterococcus sp. 10A9_DIV0425]